MLDGVAIQLKIRLRRRSVEMIDWLVSHLRNLVFYWTMFASLASGIRFSKAPFLDYPIEAQRQAVSPNILFVATLILPRLLSKRVNLIFRHRLSA